MFLKSGWFYRGVLLFAYCGESLPLGIRAFFKKAAPFYFQDFPGSAVRYLKN